MILNDDPWPGFDRSRLLRIRGKCTLLFFFWVDTVVEFILVPARVHRLEVVCKLKDGPVNVSYRTPLPLSSHPEPLRRSFLLHLLAFALLYPSSDTNK